MMELPSGGGGGGGGHASGGHVRYVCVDSVREDHEKPLYGICFNTCDMRHANVFATVGDRRASIYRAHAVNRDGTTTDANANANTAAAGNSWSADDLNQPMETSNPDPPSSAQRQPTIECLQVYVDENPDEHFFCCTFTRDVHDADQPILCVGGEKGVIRVLDCHTCELRCSLFGHGYAVNEVKIHPSRPSLLLSASKDESLRLWNIHTQTLVVVCAGDGGHRSEVLSIDWHLDAAANGKFVSCGMDNALKIWSLKKHNALMDASETFDAFGDATSRGDNYDDDDDDDDGKRASKRSKRPSLFPTRYVSRPIFSTTKVHSNYIDCVRWFGDLLLSKSVDSKILLWRPDEKGPTKRRGDVRVLQEFQFEQCNLWFIRFSLDPRLRRLCIGNRVGTMFVWSVPGTRNGGGAGAGTSDDMAPRSSSGRTRSVEDLTAGRTSTGEAVVYAPAPLVKLKTQQCKLPIRQTAISSDLSIVLGVSEDGTIWRYSNVSSE
ncbi:hypothetical protein PPROV_001013600 [Pycnococcus provasolii]|uniref:Polycomb protein EED n=1 Tax=Pycnococcus provasolii TaxID=41880 RepID=A0A830HWT7_9CHLO|nr:hypothetical protein PPROV_001013600 [Pycnococcus provasolii]